MSNPTLIAPDASGPPSRSLRKGFLFVLLVIAILACERAVSTSAAFTVSPTLLRWAIAIDLLVVVPALAWLLLVRSGLARVRTAIGLVLGTLFLASLLLPADAIPAIGWIRHALLPFEVGLLTLVLWSVARLLRTAPDEFRSDPLIAVERTIERVTGNAFLARVMASEWATVRYSLPFWSRKVEAPAEASCHAIERNAAITATLSSLVAVETMAVHLLVAIWSPLAAWILTVLSIYSLVWLVGEHRALRLRPTFISGDRIVLRVGLRGVVELTPTEIASFGACTWRDLEGVAASEILNLSTAGEPNVIVRFRAPTRVRRWFGLNKETRGIALQCADAARLIADLTSVSRTS